MTRREPGPLKSRQTVHPLRNRDTRSVKLSTAKVMKALLSYQLGLSGDGGRRSTASLQNLLYATVC